ncbi:MAG: hypothetical protein C0478_07050 [Planctomyces sp.]|nr:hypothetical protein [Planctomyces sp.]
MTFAGTLLLATYVISIMPTQNSNAGEQGKPNEEITFTRTTHHDKPFISIQVGDMTLLAPAVTVLFDTDQKAAAIIPNPQNDLQLNMKSRGFDVSLAAKKLRVPLRQGAFAQNGQSIAFTKE